MLQRRRRFIALSALAFPNLGAALDAHSSKHAMKPKSVLLVVDAQVGVLSTIWESKRVIANIEHLVRTARAADALVVWVQHSDDDELKFGSEAWKLAPNFAPTAAETLLHKKYNSSFAKTDLDIRLRSAGITRVVLAGAATNWCVRATAYAAVDRGYNLTLVSDAHSTQPIELGDGRVFAPESVIADLNVVFQWLSAPDAKTDVVETLNVSF